MIGAPSGPASHSAKVNAPMPTRPWKRRASRTRPRSPPASSSTCALLSTGHVDCWGFNGEGQLGAPSGECPSGGSWESPCSLIPLEVQGITNAADIAAGASHVCVALSTGHVECWGNNRTGQLGNGKNTSSDTPVEAQAITDATRVAADENGSCAVTSSGYVDCWGGATNTPVRVQGIANATTVSAGGGHRCALLSTGVAECWGANESGQLGDGNRQSSETPVEVHGIANLTDIAAGEKDSCAVPAAGPLECWGGNDYGQLGDGQSREGRDTPGEVWDISGAAQVAAGSEQTCAVLTSSHVECWGRNEQGQLGNGSTLGADIPVEVQGLTGATEVATGSVDSCAVLLSGHVDCWGESETGQLGGGSTTKSTTPVEVQGITNAIQVANGSFHSCAVLSTGHVECWGEGVFGQLGDGTSAGSGSPVEVHGITNATQVAAGGYDTCAVLSTHHVDCWGEGNFGQLGDGTSSGPETCTLTSARGKRGEVERIEYSCSMIPVEVGGVTDATQVAVGHSHACALLSGGRVTCWGRNGSGQLGDGTLSGPETCYSAESHFAFSCSATPVEVQDITEATQVAAGSDHSCARLITGQVDCWGGDGSGQLGAGVSQECAPPAESYCSDVPIEVEDIVDATDVAAGGSHTCGVLATGSLDCWGWDSSGQLGQDGPWSELPRKVVGVSAPPDVVTGSAGSVTDGSARLAATAFPGGEEVTECEFEYGTSRAYGSSVPCSPAVGSGGGAVPVGAAISGLPPGTGYHFRVSVTSADGTVYGADQAFTTLQAYASGETVEPAVPARASAGGLSVEASGGTGSVTIGTYPANPAGPVLAGVKGPYFEVGTDKGSTFAKLEYMDCELGGARTLWWHDPATGWEPFPQAIAVYDESSGCITVTATATSHPSIAQLSDAREGAGPGASEEFGKCVPAGHGHFERQRVHQGRV